MGGKIVNLCGNYGVMAEEIENGLNLICDDDKIVTFFGSARTHPDDRYYHAAVNMGAKAVSAGFAVMTGGGPGAMEAAAKGAYDAGGKTYGINIILPHEQRMNNFVTVPYTCKFMFIRKMLLVMRSSAFVILPGGFGTLDELYDVLTLIVTNNIQKVPVVLYGAEFWNGLENWMSDKLLADGYISSDYLDIISITDDEDEVIRIISQ